MGSENLHVRLTRFENLSDSEINLWNSIHTGHSEFHNPLFSADASAIVSSIREDFEVAVFESEGQPIGFLPFHRKNGGCGTLIADTVSDAHAVIIPPGHHWQPRTIVREMGLSSLHFDHLIADQEPWHPHTHTVENAAVIDLSNGFDSYIESLTNSGSKVVAQIQRKMRKVEREVGPLRFEWHRSDSRDLHMLIDWKKQIVRRQGLHNVFQIPWVMQYLEQQFIANSKLLSGVLSVLSAGDKPIAAHFGIAGINAMNSWIPAHDEQFRSYSPGMILHWHLANEAAERGIKRIELGRGTNSLKQRLKNADISMAIGAVYRKPLKAAVANARHRMFEFFNQSKSGRASLALMRRIRNRLR